MSPVLLRGALAFLLLAAAPAAAVEQLDWCSPVVVRPDQRWWSYAPCEPWWKPDTIAARADFVMDGFPAPAPQVLPPDPVGCFGSLTLANSNAFNADLRARAAARGRTLRFVWYQRFDVVDRQMAAAPGFDASFTVPSAIPWGQATDFFAKDTTETCVCGCAWSPERGPSGTPAGTRMKDLIDATGGAGAYETKVQYAIRPSTGGSADGAPRQFYGSAVVTNLRDPAYRQWIVAQTQAGLLAGGYDAVQLNQKFNQYLPSSPPFVWGSSLAPDVERYMSADEGLWSGPGLGYGYPQYVEGWVALAADLAAAGIAYTVTLTPMQWRPGFTIYDDPSTPGVDENALIRSAAYAARWVFLDKIGGGSDADVAAAVADLAAHGSATAVVENSGCGYGPPDNPVNPLPAIGGQVAVTPDAGALGQYQGRDITVRPYGTAAGAWNADFWCHCPFPPCGAPDASATGLVASAWSVPPGACDARWGDAVGSYRPRVRITRAGYTAESLDTVTICQPACSNGKDDDGDGLVDFPSDPGCGSASDRYENLQCDNGKDDDGDGLVDYPFDPGCVTPSQSRETPPRSCGLLGPEACLALLGACAARRRAARGNTASAGWTVRGRIMGPPQTAEPRRRTPATPRAASRR